jgi:hypothetical protein
MVVCAAGWLTAPDRFPLTIPANTAVPHWAYLDVVVRVPCSALIFPGSDSSTDHGHLGRDRRAQRLQLRCALPRAAATDADAETLVGAPESTGGTPPASTIGTSSLPPVTGTGISTSAALAPSSAATPAPAAAASKSNAGAIAGGVVGGVVGVGLIGLAGFLLYRRRRRRAPSAQFVGGKNGDKVDLVGAASPAPGSGMIPPLSGGHVHRLMGNIQCFGRKTAGKERKGAGKNLTFDPFGTGFALAAPLPARRPVEV